MMLPPEYLAELSRIDMSAKAMRGVLAIVARIAAWAEEGHMAEAERKRKDRERKFRGRSMEIPRKIPRKETDTSTEIPAGALSPKQKVSPITPSKTQPLSAVADSARGENSDVSRETNYLAHWPAWLRVAEAIGVHIDDPDWFSRHGRVAQWLADGWDLDLDILPTIKQLVAKKKTGRPIRRLEYFEMAIADAHASRTAPVPTGTPERAHAGQNEQPSGIVAAGKRRIAQLRELAERECPDNFSGESNTGIGTSNPNVRLISSG